MKPKPLTEGKTKTNIKNNFDIDISNTMPPLYHHVVPDSCFWDNIETIQNFLKYSHLLTKEQLVNALKIGLSNTLERGYNIQKIK